MSNDKTEKENHLHDVSKMDTYLDNFDERESATIVELRAAFRIFPSCNVMFSSRYDFQSYEEKLDDRCIKQKLQ